MQPNSPTSAAGYTPARAFSGFSICVLTGALAASLGMHPVFALLMALLPLLLRPLCLWPLRLALVLSLALAFSFCLTMVRKENHGPNDDDLFFYQGGGKVKIAGTIEDVRERHNGDDHTCALVLSADRLVYPVKRSLDGKVLVNIESPAEPLQNPLLPGDCIEVSGVFCKPKAKNFSFEFDEARWLSSQGIFARLSSRADDVYLVGSSKSLGSVFNRTVTVLRRQIVDAHTRHLGAVGGALFSSMVLGDRVVAIDQDLKQEFSRIGLSHLLAASGLNLTIIVAAALALCRFFQRGTTEVSWLQTWISFACVVLFTSFAGAGPSVSRAAIMCLIALWARLAFVRLAHGSALAVALLIALALDPLSVADVGLQLSYGATFGIIYIYPLFEVVWLKQIKNRLLKIIASLVSVVVAAQIAVLPIQLHVFQQLSILVLPANLLAEPVVVPLTILGFVSSILAAIAESNAPQLQLITKLAAYGCFCLDWLAQFPLAWLMQTAHFLAALPMASLTVARPQAAHVVLYCALLMGVMAFGKLRPRLACALLLLASVLLTAVSYIESPLLEFFCTGQEVVVNRGNLAFFVWSKEPDSAAIKNSAARNFVRYLSNRGVPRVSPPGFNSQVELTLAPEHLLIRPAWPVKLSRYGKRSDPPVLEFRSVYKGVNQSLTVVPPGYGEQDCHLNGRLVTPSFIPYCPWAMPFCLPLFADSECQKTGYYLRFRL